MYVACLCAARVPHVCSLLVCCSYLMVVRVLPPCVLPSCVLPLRVQHTCTCICVLPLTIGAFMLHLYYAAMETRVQTHNSNYTRQCSIKVLLTLFKNYRLGYSLKLFYRCWSKSSRCCYISLLGCDKLFAVLFIFHIFFFYCFSLFFSI